jgi:hypothetical protein
MKSNPYYYIEGEIAQAEREGNLQLADGLRRSLERMKNKTRAQRRALGRSIDNSPYRDLVGKRKKGGPKGTTGRVRERLDLLNRYIRQHLKLPPDFPVSTLIEHLRNDAADDPDWVRRLKAMYFKRDDSEPSDRERILRVRILRVYRDVKKLEQRKVGL